MDYDILKYSHVIWDFNGTLLNDCDMAITAVNELLKKRDLPMIAKETYRENFDFPVIDFYLFLGFDLITENYDKVAREFTDEYFKYGFNCPLQEGVLDLLKLFKEKGIPQSVLSASHKDHLEKYLKALSIDGYFSTLMGQDNYRAAAKSQKGIELIEILSLDPKGVIYFGDTCHDFEVANTINCDHLLVANGHQSKQNLLKATDRVIDSLCYLL